MNNGQKSLSINETFIVEGDNDGIISACTGIYTSAIISCFGDSQINMGTGIISTLSSFSATTFYGDGSNLTGVSKFDTFVTGGTYNDITGVATFTNNTGGTFNITGFYTGSTDIYITAVTFTNNQLSLFRNDGVTLGATIDNFTNLNVNGSVSATTYYGDGSNLTGISTQDTFVTGGTYSAGTAVFTNNTGGTFSVTGFSNSTGTSFTGGTVNGSTIFTNGLTANTFALSSTPSTNTTNTDVLTLNQSTGVIEQRSINSLTNVVNLVTVGLTGSTSVDYNSIKDAVDSITGASPTNTYVVKVGPGVFYEDPITMKSYVDVIGESETNTIIQANNPNTSLIIGADQSMVSDVQIQGCTGTSVAAVVYSSPTTPQLNAIFYVENVRFGANYTHAKTVGTSGGNCIMQCSNVKYGGYPFTIGFYVTNDGSGVGRMQLRNVTSTNGGVTTTSGLIFAKADQPNCAFIVNGCLLTKATGAAAGTGFWVENGGSLRLTAVNFQRWSTGIYAPQVGSAPSIEAIALNFENCTTDVNIIHSGATGKVQGTDNYSKTLINIDAPLYEVNQDPRIITVAKKGGDFSSIKSAVDSITGSSSNNRFLVSVGPGRFSESLIDLTGKPYVSIEGSNIITTEIVPNSGAQHIIKVGQNNELSFFSLSGAPAGYAGIYVYDVGDYAQAHKISFIDCDTNVWVESDTQDTIFFGEYLDYNGSYSYGTKVIANNGYVASANIENYYNFPTGTGTTIANRVQGSGATLNVFVGDGVGNGVTGSTNYEVFDYASLNTTTTTADGWDYCVRNPNIGGPVRFDIDSISVVNSIIYDISVEHPSTFGTFNGSASHVKINSLSNDVYWSFLDIDDGEFDVTRKISVTFQDGTHTDASTLIFEGSTMGLIEGGVITHISGLTFQVSAGFGYLEKTIGNGIHMRIDWGDTQITLSPNTENYLHFNENNILSSTSNAPDNVTNIILGRVVTNSTTVRFIDATPYNARHTSNLLSTFNRNALGPIYTTGSLVTENATPYHLNISSGDYYYSENNFLPSGGTNVNFTQYYRDGSTGWITTGTTEVVNGYDDDSGTISPLPLSSFTKHTLYVVGDGLNEEYMLVLGQTYYTTLVEAEGADLPTPPTYFDDGVTSIASIYIQQGLTGITQIQDIRPVIGFKAAGVSATAVHGNLLGLNADDHTQYLLVDGARAMSGNLSMGGNAIFSALTVNGVTVESHASRHKNGGADEIASATPAPSEIPKADSFGKLDGWISDASTTVKGLTRLSQAPASASIPIAVGVNDPRFLNSITAVTNTTPSLVFSNNSGGTTTISNLRLASISATTISATTYQNLPTKYYAEYSVPPTVYPIASGLESIAIGNGAVSASNYMFVVGNSAGSGATSASYSNFIGNSAGRSASGASDSNFFGQQAGLNALNAAQSNFIGLVAGGNATNASNSNFIGFNAGYLATSASYSNFMGTLAGGDAANAYESNFFGTSAGNNAISANNSNFFGSNAGNSATNATESNFFGTSAGNSATDAYNSNFMGYQAGNSATDAYNSNFMGTLAGRNAANASDSNFIGNEAGYQATNANNSNFFGSSAGYQATDAHHSNFFGNQAGYQATDVYDSNFIGRSSGNIAVNANNSNFFGRDAGYEAINANSSNFFGYQAGFQASGATNSNFIGENAGDGATSAYNSNFFGSSAGYQATNAYQSNFFGRLSGNLASGATQSNFIGNFAGREATNAYDSNFIGSSAGYGATNAINSNFLGNNVGRSATDASYSNFLGNNAGSGATNASFSNFLGRNAGYSAANADNSNFLGSNAGIGATNANNSNFLGTLAGNSATGASYSTLIGYNVGNGSTLGSIGSNNIIIGTNVSLSAGTTNSINIGGVLFGTGTYSATAGAPSLSGQTNGRIGINTNAPAYPFQVGVTNVGSGSDFTVQTSSSAAKTVITSQSANAIVGANPQPTITNGIPTGASFGTTTNGIRTTLGYLGTTAGGGVYLNFSTNGANSGLHVTHNYGSDLMTVYNNGNTGIGTASDAGFKLDVSGTTRISGTLTVGSTGNAGTINLARDTNGAIVGAIIQGAGFTTIRNYQGSGINFHVTGVSDVERMFVRTGGVGITGTQGGIFTLDASALLQGNSTTQGFLSPRMTTVQKNAIASPATGLTVYDTTTLTPSFYNGVNWQNVIIPNSSGTTVISGDTIIQGGLTATTISASTYLNLPSTPTSFVFVTGNTTLSNANQTVIVDSLTAITVTLPQITADGTLITIKNINTGVETILPYSGQLIDGDTSVVVARRNVSLDFQSYNNNWYLI